MTDVKIGKPEEGQIYRRNVAEQTDTSFNCCSAIPLSNKTQGRYHEMDLFQFKIEYINEKSTERKTKK